VLDLFRHLDTNADGQVTQAELAGALAGLGLQVSPPELKELFDQLDPDRSGGIDFRELQQALRSALSSHAATDAPVDASTSGDGEPWPVCVATGDAGSLLASEPGGASEHEFALLDEMLSVALASGGPGPADAESISLMHMLNAYEMVLERHSILAIEARAAPTPALASLAPLL